MTGELPPGVTSTFRHPCHWCGATVHVIDGFIQRHRCRIDLDAQRAAYYGPDGDPV